METEEFSGHRELFGKLTSQHIQKNEWKFRNEVGVENFWK